MTKWSLWKKTISFLVGFSLLTLLVACGAKDKSVGGLTLPIDNPGVGSGSLRVTATVAGEQADPGAYLTNFTVNIFDSLTLPVNNATVTFRLPNGSLLNIPRDLNTNGRYRYTLNTYTSGTYWLTVTRGTDSIQNAFETGPDIHTITAPALTDTLLTDSAFTVRWARRSLANEAEVSTRDFGPVETADSGVYLVPAPQQQRDNQRIRVKRTNEVILNGGLPGSVLSISIRRDLEPIIVQ